jgi:sulfoxide reductase heme-binding subunit YedZ
VRRSGRSCRLDIPRCGPVPKTLVGIARNQPSVADDGLGMTETEAGAPDVTSGHLGEIPPTEEAPTTAGPRRPWQQALAADLRAMIPDLSLSLLLTGLVFGYLWWRVSIERSEAVSLIGRSMEDFGYNWTYFLLQAIGWAALWWAWGTVILGLLVAGGRPSWLRLPTGTIEKLHRTTSLTVIALTLVHILLMVQWRLVKDDYGIPRALKENFIPGMWNGTSSGNWGIGVGGTAFWLALVLGLTYYFRHRIGVRTWRFTHRFSIVVYVLAAWHAFIYSTNTWFTGYQRTALWVMQLPIAYMFITRLLAPLRRSERLPLSPAALRTRLGTMTVARLGVRVIAAAAIVVLLGVLALDRTGGRERPPYPDPEDEGHAQGE